MTDPNRYVLGEQEGQHGEWNEEERLEGREFHGNEDAEEEDEDEEEEGEEDDDQSDDERQPEYCSADVDGLAPLCVVQPYHHLKWWGFSNQMPLPSTIKGTERSQYTMGGERRTNIYSANPHQMMAGISSVLIKYVGQFDALQPSSIDKCI